MSVPLVLVITVVVLFACGVYLLLDRSLTRVLLGFLLVGNGTNLLLFLTSGNFGVAPIAGEAEAAEMSDPLPQAFILTSIVITFGVSAFMLALIYRSWRLAQQDEDAVHDDDADIELSGGETLTTEEVTDEDLEESEEFEEFADDDDYDDSAASDASASVVTDHTPRSAHSSDGRTEPRQEGRS